MGWEWRGRRGWETGEGRREMGGGEEGSAYLREFPVQDWGCQIDGVLRLLLLLRLLSSLKRLRLLGFLFDWLFSRHSFLPSLLASRSTRSSSRRRLSLLLLLLHSLHNRNLNRRTLTLSLRRWRILNAHHERLVIIGLGFLILLILVLGSRLLVLGVSINVVRHSGSIDGDLRLLGSRAVRVIRHLGICMSELGFMLRLILDGVWDHRVLAQRVLNVVVLEMLRL
jgi:hypothetical protein